MDAHALILEHLDIVGRIAGAHARRTRSDPDEVRSDAYLGLVIAVQKWLESDRSIELQRWVVTRVIFTMKDEWRIRHGLQRQVPTPVMLPLDYAQDRGDDGWWLGNDPAVHEAGYQAVEDREYIEWLAGEASSCPDMTLAVAAASTPLQVLAERQDPPVTDTRVCQRVRIGRRKLRELAQLHRPT
jgi:hypothetical protein